MPRRDPSTAYLRTLGLVIRRQRERLGISQEEFSFRCELDRTYVSGIERGVRNPTVKTLLRLAKGLGLKPGTLVTAADRDVAG